MKIKKNIFHWLLITGHIIVWVYLYKYYSGVVLVLEMNDIKLPNSFISQSIHYGMVMNALIFYLNYYLIGKYMAVNIIQYLIISALMVLLISTVETVIDVSVLSKSAFPSLINLFAVVFLFNIKVHSFFWLISGISKTSINWITQIRAKEIIKAQHTETELALLKSQVHPHFLFNTLNTLYSSAYEFGDKETAIGIGKLSHLLRYMLYETQTDKVLLENEVEYLENYLDLSNMRFSDQVDVKFEVKGQIENYKIAPMMLITLVENAFKHGISPATQTDISIS